MRLPSLFYSSGEKWDRLEELFLEKSTTSLTKITFLFIPIILIASWQVFVFWTLGISGWRTSFFGILIIIFGLAFAGKNLSFQYSDIRWLLAPFVIFLIAWYVPWWDYHHQRFDTGAYMFSALEFLDHRNFPEYLLFRSPLVPGFFSMEVFLSRNTYIVFWTPLLLFIGTAWQVQHLAERWSSKQISALCTLSFILLPSIRYWGQMAMTDVAVCGIWLFSLHLLSKSEKNPERTSLALLLGISIGLTFMTKQTHIYLFGLCGWLVVKDRDFQRMKSFLKGWLIITIPFMFHHTLVSGHPFAPLLGQTEFAIKSVTGTYDSYTTGEFLSQLIDEVNLIVLLASIVGSLVLIKKDKSDAIAVSVMLLPLLILNGIILDWGEPRYNTPIFALIILFLAVDFSSDFNQITDLFRSKQPRDIFAAFTVLLLLSTTMVNLVELPSDSVDAHTYNENMDEWTNFEVLPLQNISDSQTLFAGRASSVSLMTGIHTIRYEPRNYGCDCENDLIANTLTLYPADYALTTNVAPYFDWEKDFDWQLGHGLIELEHLHYQGWWSAALWKIDNTSYLSPHEYYSHNTGEAIGDLTILRPNDSLTIGNSSLSLKWIEVTSIRPYQQVMRILTGEVELMRNGSIESSAYSSFEPGEVLSASEDTYIYVWVEHESSE